MRLVDRYVFAELIVPFFIGTLAVLMMLVGNTLYQLLPRLLQDHLPIGAVVRICVLNIPTVLVMTLPVSTTLAVSLASNRMARENEITVMRAGGQSLFRSLVPMYVFGAIMSGLTYYISDSVVPWAWREQQNVQQIIDTLPSNPVDIGLTFRADNYTITFNSAQKISPTIRRLNKVVIVENLPGETSYATINTAETADYENGLWTLHKVVRHVYGKDGLTQYDVVSEKGTLPLKIDFNGMYAPPTVGQYSQYAMQELIDKGVEARRFGNFRDAVGFEVERRFRVSFAEMCLVMTFLAPPLCLRFSRAGAFTGVLLSIISVFVAWNTLLLMKYVGLGELVSPVIAAWATNVLFTAAGIWLLRVQE